LVLLLLLWRCVLWLWWSAFFFALFVYIDGFWRFLFFVLGWRWLFFAFFFLFLFAGWTVVENWRDPFSCFASFLCASGQVV
jgi:hypothetical protein